MKISYFLLFVCLISVVSADSIYKWVDGQGNVHYGDEPGQRSSKKMDHRNLPGLSTYAPPPKPVQQEKGLREEVEDSDELENDEPQEPKEQATAYRSLTIIKPEKGETLRSNPGDIEVFVALAPKLGKRDHLRVSLDGKQLNAKFSKMVMQLQNVDRGEHQLSVAVYNDRGKRLIKSDSHTFYLHKVSVLKKSPKS